MDSIRVTAKTVEDALTEASIELGTSSDNIEYTVIDKGSSGFFGIGGRKAVIEAKRKFTDEDLKKEIFGDQDEKPKKEFKKEFRQEKKEYRKEQGKDKKKEEKKPAGSSVGRKDANAPEAAGQEKKDSFSGRSAEKKDSFSERAAEKKDSFSERSTEKQEEGKTSGFVRKEGRKNSYRSERRRDFRQEEERRNPVKSETPEDSPETVSAPVKPVETDRFPVQKGTANTLESAEISTEAAAVAEARTEEIRPRVPADPEEAKRRAESFLKDVLNVMDITAEIHMEFEEDNLSVEISGEDMGVLIGKRGQTLDSLQYLTSLVVNKGKASYVRVKLDTEDYRNRRKATLENLAKNIALKVKKTRRPVFLEPMNPYERRIIHSALQNDPYVTTHSEGEEPFRKVVVTVRKDREKDLEREFERRNRRSSYGYGRRNGRYSERRSFRQQEEDAGVPVTEETPVSGPDEAPKDTED